MVWDDPLRVALLLVTVVVGPWWMLAAWHSLDATTVRGRLGEAAADVRSDLQGVRQRLGGSDDAPLWAEAIGAVVPFGLLSRGACHVLVARAHGLDGTIAGRDVAAGNAVAAIRDGDEREADLNGRVASVLVGLVLWWSYLPGAGPTLAVDASHALAGIAQAYMTLNVAVLFGDIVLFAAVLNRSLTNTDADSHVPT